MALAEVKKMKILSCKAVGLHYLLVPPSSLTRQIWGEHQPQTFVVLFHGCPLSPLGEVVAASLLSVKELFRGGWQKRLHLMWFPDVDISSRT